VIFSYNYFSAISMKQIIQLLLPLQFLLLFCSDCYRSLTFIFQLFWISVPIIVNSKNIAQITCDTTVKLTDRGSSLMLITFFFCITNLSKVISIYLRSRKEKLGLKGMLHKKNDVANSFPNLNHIKAFHLNILSIANSSNGTLLILLTYHVG
jgi:hypothetical protein